MSEHGVAPSTPTHGSHANVPPSPHASDSGARGYVGDHEIKLQDIIKFLFPSGVQHPNSPTRLFLLADYGPLYAEHAYSSCLCATCMKKCRERVDSDSVLKEFYRGEPMRMSDWSHYSELLCPKCTQHCMNIVHIKSGFKGTHIVSDGEMHIMERDFERDEIVSMYMPKGTMSQEELERVVYHLPPRLRHQHIYTQDEIIDMFAKCQKAPSGAYVFQNFVEIAKQAHKKRIIEAKKMFADVAGKGRRPKPALSALGKGPVAANGPTSAKSVLTMRQAMGEPMNMTITGVQRETNYGFLKPLPGSSMCLSVKPPLTTFGLISPEWKRTAVQTAGRLIATGQGGLGTTGKNSLMPHELKSFTHKK